MIIGGVKVCLSNFWENEGRGLFFFLNIFYLVVNVLCLP